MRISFSPLRTSRVSFWSISPSFSASRSRAIIDSKLVIVVWSDTIAVMDTTESNTPIKTRRWNMVIFRSMMYLLFYSNGYTIKELLPRCIIGGRWKKSINKKLKVLMGEYTPNCIPKHSWLVHLYGIIKKPYENSFFETHDPKKSLEQSWLRTIFLWFGNDMKNESMKALNENCFQEYR